MARRSLRIPVARLLTALNPTKFAAMRAALESAQSREAASTVNGLEIVCNLRLHGRVAYVSDPPDRAWTDELLQTVADAATETINQLRDQLKAELADLSGIHDKTVPKGDQPRMRSVFGGLEVHLRSRVLQHQHPDIESIRRRTGDAKISGELVKDACNHTLDDWAQRSPSAVQFNEVAGAIADAIQLGDVPPNSFRDLE